MKNTWKECNYLGTPIFEYNTDFIGLILKTEKIEYLILKFKINDFNGLRL